VLSKVWLLLFSTGQSCGVVLPSSDSPHLPMQEHEQVKDRIRNIIDSYSDFAEDSNAMSETTSKYQLDSLFEDFEGIIVRENNTLVGIHDNLKKSEVKGSALIQELDKDGDKMSVEMVEMSKRAREALHDSLTKIASAMRSKTSLTAAELQTLQSEMKKAFDTITNLEGECQRHLGALGSMRKEYDNYRDHSLKKIKGMDDTFNHRLNDLMLELRQTEIKQEEAEAKVKAHEKTMKSFRGSAKSNSGWGDSPKNSSHKSNREGGGGAQDDGKDSESEFDYVPSARQFADKIEKLEKSLAQKDRQIKSLENEVETLHKKEMEIIMKQAAASAPKKVTTATTQTVTEENKVYPMMRSNEHVIDYLEKFLEHYKHPNVLSVLEELKKMRAVGDDKTKEASSLMRENRILQKKFGDATKSLEDAERKLKEGKGGGGGGGSGSKGGGANGVSGAKLKGLEFELKDALAGKDALQKSLDMTSELLASTTTEMQGIKGDLMAERMKTMSLKSLMETKQKQLYSVKSALSEQKEALDSLIEDQGEKEGEEKMKYMQMMGELNKKLEEMNKREATLGEREVLLGVREKEVGVLKDDLEGREKVLENRAKGVEEREKGVEEREKGVKEEAKRMAESMKVVEVVETSGGEDEEEIERLKDLLRKFGEVDESEKVLRERKEKLFEMEAEVEELEHALENRRKEWDEGSHKLTEMEARLKMMENELTGREKSLESRKTELEVKEVEMKEKFDKVGLESEGLLHHDHPEGEDDVVKATRRQSRKGSVIVQPSSFKDMQMIANLKEKVAELEEDLKKKEDEIILLQGDLVALKEKMGKMEESRKDVVAEQEEQEQKGLRVMVDDYEKRMGEMTRLRAELEEREGSLKEREEALEKRTEEMEEHLAKELANVETMKVSVKTSAPPGVLSGVDFDWIRGDYRGNQNQLKVLLMMVEDWVEGMKNGTWGKGEGSEDGLVLVEDGEGEDGVKKYKLLLTEMHINPLTSIYGVFKDVLQGGLRRKFQNVILQVERFGGFLTPEVCRKEIVLAKEELERGFKRHCASMEESSTNVSQVERQMVKLMNQAKANPEMSYSVVRNVVKKYGEKVREGTRGAYRLLDQRSDSKSDGRNIHITNNLRSSRRWGRS